MPKPTVCVVGTGGTIASKFDPEIGGFVSAASAEDLVAAAPGLADVAEIRTVEHFNINSALIDTPTVFALRDTLREALAPAEVAGAVVTHGTATLEETAYLMDLTLGAEKPVVVTGAQRNFDEKDADGPRNVLYAAMIAADPAARERGVLVSLGGEIHAALEAVKAHTQRLTAFTSRNAGPVGMVSQEGVVFFSRPERRIHLEVDHVKENVHLIPMTQGSSDLLLRACIREKADGMVLDAVGSGNMNLPFYRAARDALEAGIPVVVTARHLAGPPYCGKGYEGSLTSLLEHGVIPGGYLSGIKARILLMAALAQTEDPVELKEIFRTVGGP